MVTAGGAAGAEPGRFVALDSLRGIAALGVAMFHLQAVSGPSTLPLFRSANLFVDFFFVLSGFVIAASYGERLTGGFGMARYMALRVGRVWPLHLFMVGAYLALELVALVIGNLGLAPGAAFTGTHSLTHLLTATFLLDGYIPDWGNFYSGAGWSISVELLLYVLAALAFRHGRGGAGWRCCWCWARRRWRRGWRRSTGRCSPALCSAASPVSQRERPAG